MSSDAQNQKSTRSKCGYQEESILQFPISFSHRLKRFIIEENGTSQTVGGTGSATMRKNHDFDYFAGLEGQVVQHHSSLWINYRFGNVDAHSFIISVLRGHEGRCCKCQNRQISLTGQVSHFGLVLLHFSWP